MRRLDPLSLGIGKALVAIAVPTALITAGVATVAPDPGLMYAIAQVGIAVVFAFIVEAVWMVERVNRDDDDHRDWLGTTCGFGFAGLAGVGVALFVGGHRAAGHANLLDSAGLWWSVTSLVMLGAIVVVNPLLADGFRAKGVGGTP